MVAVAAIIAIMALAIMRLGNPMLRYFQHSRAEQQANEQLRICLETITRTLSNAKASSLVVSGAQGSELSFIPWMVELYDPLFAGAFEHRAAPARTSGSPDDHHFASRHEHHGIFIFVRQYRSERCEVPSS